MNFFQNRLLVCFFVILRYISLALNFSPSDLYRTEILRKIPYSRKFNHCPSSSLTLLSHGSFYFPPKIQSIIREYRFIVNTQRLSVCFFFFDLDYILSIDLFLFFHLSSHPERKIYLYLLVSSVIAVSIFDDAVNVVSLVDLVNLIFRAIQTPTQLFLTVFLKTSFIITHVTRTN